MKNLYDTLTEKFGIGQDDIFMYGHEIAKIKYDAFPATNKKGKIVLVTAISPTSAGEGKTTTAIGLVDALNNELNVSAIGALREPSMGPVFGMKGCATGGGECVIEPATKINLHFTGDLHAITSANNLVSAALDSTIYWSNPLKINPKRIVWTRCLDVNDRALRDVTICIKKNLFRDEHFKITAASEMMAILSLASDWTDLEKRLNRILIAYTYDDKPIYLASLNISGALLAILQDAINPNVVFTKYGNLSFVHCGPFANIAHGTNSVVSTKLAQKMADYVISEVGFGSDLGFEKYMDLVSLQSGLLPSVSVLVVSVRALKLHGGCSESELDKPGVEFLKLGLSHLEAHWNIIKHYNVPCVISVNRFSQDSEEEIAFLTNYLNSRNYEYALNDAYHRGPSGALTLAKKVIVQSNQAFETLPLYAANDAIIEKIKKIVEQIYQVKHWEISDQAKEKIDALQQSNDSAVMPICMVKSHLTIAGNKLNENSDDYVLRITDIEVNHGAGFIRVYTNDVITMPGLNKSPAYERIKVINGKIINMK